LASGRMPRVSASHTSNSASGRMMNCGRITPLRSRWPAANACPAFRPPGPGRRC
jgi:hypothetical protein